MSIEISDLKIDAVFIRNSTGKRVVVKILRLARSCVGRPKDVFSRPEGQTSGGAWQKLKAFLAEHSKPLEIGD